MWNGHKIAYVSATFLGTRANQQKAHNFYVDDYLPGLFKNATCIDRIIIPCNAEDHHLSHFEEMEKKVAEYQKTTDIPITLFRRPNTHFSYGAWNAALQDYCDDVDFAFLLEDDYVVCKHGFDEEILFRYYSKEVDRESVLFCASWFLSTGWWDLGHAAISNGLINVKLFRNNGNTFHLDERGSHCGPHAQSQFLTSFKDKGLSIRNMAAEYCIPFLHPRGRVSYYGNFHGPVVFIPVQLVTESDHFQGKSLTGYTHSETWQGRVGSSYEVITAEEFILEAQQQKVHVFPEDLHVEDMAGFSVLSGGTTVDAETMRTGYVCAVYFGPRRSWVEHWGDVDPLYCLREHVKVITECATHIERVIFVCNLREDGSDEETYKEAVSIIEAKNAEDDREWVICSRPNYAFSYGAWEHALTNHADGLDFSFLIEDDYIPCKVGFDTEMVMRYFTDKENRDRVVYCSCCWKYNLSSNSNGIINLAVFRTRNTFSLPGIDSRRHIYKHGDACQRLFLRKFTDRGFKIIDMSVDYVFPFFCMDTKKDIPYGGPFPGRHVPDAVSFTTEGETLLRPISYEGAIRNVE
jgi:hypothetical protein